MWLSLPLFPFMFLSHALGMMRDLLFSTLSIFSLPVFSDSFRVFGRSEVSIFRNVFEEMTLESASDIVVCALQYNRQEKASETSSFGEKIKEKQKSIF